MVQADLKSKEWRIVRKVIRRLHTNDRTTCSHAQVQKLLARHKAEMTALQNAGIEDTRRALEAAATQHEVALKALKDKMTKVGGC